MFQAPYKFGISNHIVIQHGGGKYIRVSPNNVSFLDPNGGQGLFAQWNVEKVNNNAFKFRSTKTGKYLRINNQGNVDCNGQGGPWTVFHSHGTGNVRKLESSKVRGRYIAVRNGQVTTGNGGQFCIFTFYRKGQQQQNFQQNFNNNFQQQTFQQPNYQQQQFQQQQNFQQQQQFQPNYQQQNFQQQNFQQQNFQQQQNFKQQNFNKQQNKPFTNGYAFARNNTVVMQHKGGQHLRVKPNKHDDLDGQGGKGQFAQWYAEKHSNHFKFKNVKTGKYLRISKKGHVDCDGNGGKWCLFKAHGNGNSRKLESVQLGGKYVAVRQGLICIGTGGPFCLFTFYRQ